MIGYTACEAELVKAIVSGFPAKLTESNTKAGDIDSVMSKLFMTDSNKYGCVVDFLGGAHKKPEGFNAPIWVWSVSAVVIMKVDMDTADADIRELIDLAARLFDVNFRLQNTVAKAEVVSIQTPTPAKVADYPYYYLPVLISIWDK